MSKLLTWMFSAALVLCSTANVGATTQTVGKVSAKTGAKSAIATMAKPAQTKAPKKSKGVVAGKVRTANAGSKGKLATARKNANARVLGANKVAPAETGDMPTIWGSVVYSDGWQSEDAPVGLYSVPTSNSQDFEQVLLGPSASYGGTLVDNTYYWCDVVSFWGYIMSIDYKGIDVTTGEEILSESGSYYTISMTTDPTTGTVYALMNIEGETELVSISFENGVEPTEIGIPSVPGVALYGWNSIACGKDGQLYGIYYEAEEVGEDYEFISSSLVKIDKTTAAVTVVGETGEIPYYMSDSTIDPKSGRMFWTVSPIDESGYLCEVNLTTGAATKVCDFAQNEEVCGLAIPAPAAEDSAPAAVENAAAVFNGGSLSGMINFTAPTKLFDGSAASGNLNYSIKANGQEIATGTTAFGASVSKEVTMPEAGLYTFDIRVSNTVGQSPSVKVSNVYVGNDTPEATSATLEYANGNMNLTWLPVTASINGGYVDANAVTYTVTRFEGQKEGVVVAENISVTSFSEEIAMPESMTQYYYTVVAKCNGLESAVAKSNVVTLGSIVPPYVADFQNDLDNFVIIDANGDGKSWTLYGTGVRVQYNSSKEMDDWLITPPLYLEAGKLYDLAAAISANGTSFPERMEIKLGRVATAEGMTKTLMEPTVLSTGPSEPVEWSYGLVPEETGLYYIGFHGISDADMYYLNLLSFSISAGRSAAAPAAGELTVTPAAMGALSATIDFTAPTKSINGNALTSLSKAELKRGDEIINTWNNPAPGASLTYVDNVTTSGTYDYSVVCYNAEGNGSIASASAFIGVNYPAAPESVTWIETSNAGEVTISWDAVTTDIDGRPLDASQVTYQVYAFEGSTRVAITEKIPATSYTYQAVASGEQEFLQYAVFAYTEAGEGDGQVSNFDPAGTPYQGMTFSADADFDSYILGISGAGGGQWGAYTDSSLEGISSCDGDDLFLGMQAYYLNDYGELFTGLITLEGMVNPSVSFYSYNIELDGGEDINEITVSVKEKGQTEWTDLETYVVNEISEPNEWGKVTTSLSAYAGKTIQVKLTVTVAAAAYTFVDCINVGSMVGNDLKLQSLTAPASVSLGDDYTVTATVVNEGAQNAASYSVELYADDVLVETKQCAALESGASAQVEFARNMSILAKDPITYFAKVVYAADENIENNQSDNVVVTPKMPVYPFVSDLAGTSNGNAVELTWSAPDVSQASAEQITQDFEDGDAFAAEYGDWTFADEDGSAVGGFQNMEVPGITVGQTTGSFWVWDQSVLGNTSFEAHSGTKYLFSLFRYDDGTIDDWAISPVLDGSAQTISFYAKSYSSTYPETIEVYYTSGSTLAPADFTKINGVGGTVPGAWTLYEAQLPAGATHFAIRSCATGSFMLMVDDVTFTPAPTKLEIKGYNVYRDGVKINDELVTTTTYTDANVEDGKTYSYNVTVVYTKGESIPSNSVSVTFEASGVNAILGGAVKVNVVSQNIVISGAEGQNIAVYSVDGKLVKSVVGEAKTVIPAAQGVYVVKTGKNITKVIVK